MHSPIQHNLIFNMITIFGNDDFYQLKKVREKIESKSIEVVVIDYKLDSDLSISFDEEGNRKFHFGSVDLSRTDIVWRSDKYIVPHFGNSEEWADGYTKAKIWKSSLDNIASVMSCPVVNSIESRQRCENKLFQLQLAKELGFNIPFSLISNSIDTIREHRSKYGGLVTKMIGDPHIPKIEAENVKQLAPPTVRVDNDYLESARGGIEPFPLFIQNEIKKKLEYRCIIVDGVIFSLSIDPSQHSIMEVDHRLGGYMVDYKPCVLGNVLEKKIKAFTRRLGLFSGCFDFIEDINGNITFLEVNHHGVWGLHDDIYEGEISSEFCNALIRRSNNSTR